MNTNDTESAPEAEPPAQRCSEAQKTDDIWDAAEGCDGEVVSAPGGGIRCNKCSGWFCF